jgi:hypothetical protein
VVAVGATELIESLGPQAIDDILVGHYVPLLEFNQTERFPLVSDYMRNIEFDKTGFEWSHYAKLSRAFKRNLRHLFTELESALE